MIKFVADSSSDRPVIPGMEVQYVPMMISTDEKSFLIGPGIIFRTDASGNDIPITVDDIHLLQSLMVFKSTTLHAGKYNIPAIQLD